MENNPQNPEETRKEFISVYISRWLKAQLDNWVNKGILNEGQREAIKGLYQWPDARAFDQGQHKKSSIKLISVLQAIGSFLIGIGVISLIAFNWPKMLNLTKLSIIIAVIVSAHMIGAYFLLYKPKYQKAGYSFIFLGNLLYGGGIWLIAQIYHLPADFPTGMFLWALGIIPFAYIVRSKLNYFLALILFVIWTFNESVGAHKPHIYFLFILLALLVPLSYYLRSKAALFICIITAGFWLVVNNIFWFWNSVTIHLFLPVTLYAILLLILSNLHLSKGFLKEYRNVYFSIGTALLSIVMFLMPLFSIYRYSPERLSISHLSMSFWVCSLILLAASIILNFISKESSLDNKGIVIKKIFPALIASALYVFLIPFTNRSMVLSLFPVVLIAFSHAYHSRSKWLIKLLLVYIFIWLPFCLMQWETPFLLFLLYLVYGGACYYLGWVFISRFKDEASGILFKSFGILSVFLSLYIFSHNQIAQDFSKFYKLPQSFDFWFLFILLYSALIVQYKYVAEFSYPKENRGLIPEEQVVVPVLFFLPGILFFVISQHLAGLWYTFIMNFFSISFFILFLIIGYRRRENYLKVMSFIALIILVGTRYCEMEWSLFYKSILFILTGIVVLTGGVFLEKNKDKVAIIE